MFRLRRPSLASRGAVVVARDWDGDADLVNHDSLLAKLVPVDWFCDVVVELRRGRVGRDVYVASAISAGK